MHSATKKECAKPDEALMQAEPSITVNLKEFNSTCQICGHQFVVLNFPDFEYGRRIFRTKGGKYMALWIGHEDRVGDEFEILLKKVAGSVRSPHAMADLFDMTFGITCDPINGEPVDPSQAPVCPSCGSEHLKTTDITTKRMVPTKLYPVRHTQWLMRNSTEQENELRAALSNAVP